MARFRQRANDEVDDTPGLAGWLYTDLLLGLAVVFLGAVSFTAVKAEEEPASTTSSTTSTTTSTSTTLVPPDPCTLLTDQEGNPNRIRLTFGLGDRLGEEFDRQLNDIVRSNLLPDGTRIGMALVFGGGSSESSAKQLAERMAEQLTTLRPAVLDTAVFRYFWDNGMSTNSVNIDVFLLKGACEG